MEIKNTGQLIQHLATKAGIAADDKNLINVLSNSELTKIPIHSDLVKMIDENLLSVETASDNHPTIGAKYKSQALNAFDKKIQAVMDEMELDEDTKTELLSITSSYKRFETLATKIKELTAAKIAVAGKGDKAAIQKQVDELLVKLKEANEQAVKKDAEHTEKLNAVTTDFLFRNKLVGKKTIYDKLEDDLRHSSLMVVINKAIQDNDAKVVYDDKGVPVLLKNDGTKLLGANHNAITLDDLIDDILAKKDILVKTQQQQGQQQQGQPPVIIPGGGQQTILGTNQSVVDFNRQQREAIAVDTQ